MADAISIQELIDARTDAKTLEQAVNGDAVTTVLSRLGETYPTLSNALNQIDGQISDANDMLVESVTILFTNGGLPATPFATKALMTASALVDGDYAQVTDGGADNGMYVKEAGAWVKSEYDPVSQAVSEAVSQAGVDAAAKSDAAKLQAVADAKLYVDDVNKSNIKGVVGKNLFDNSKVEPGKGIDDSGTSMTAAGRNISEYIAAEPNTVYSFSNTRKAAFYDANKEFVQLVPLSPANVTSASNAAFVRIDVTDANLNTAQIELGAVQTAYEPYAIALSDNSVAESTIKNGAVSGDKLQVSSVEGKHLVGAVWLNNHNSLLLRKGITLNVTNADGYTEIPNAAHDLTEFMAVKPNTNYITSGASRVFFYRKDGSFISALAGEPSFITPEDCYLVRCMMSAGASFRFQMNEGTVLPSSIPQPHKFYLPELNTTPQSKMELSATLGRKINFSDAWFAWRSGEKFPICFLGDSTTNGNGTTGLIHRLPTDSYGKDFVGPNTYSKLMQDYVRDATGNSIMRVYNAGFSGRNSGWALTNIDTILGEDYADTKMLGISHGINDKTASIASYAGLFYERIEGLINWCFDKGIQPFLLTTQPVTMPSIDGTASGPEINEIANSIKKNLADKYNLELIDVNKFAEVFMQYSKKPLLNNIMEHSGNTIHFGDGGHRFTADLLFASFSKNVVWTDGSVQLDYSTQSLRRSDMRWEEMVQLAEFKHGFKLESTGTHTNSDDKLYQEFWLFNHGKSALELKAYFANQVNGQYVVVNGEITTMTSQGQVVAVLDIGLHKIQAFSGTTNQLDWLGFKATMME